MGKKKNDTNEEDFFALLSKARTEQEKDMDSLAELFQSLVVVNELTVNEVCALAYYTVNNALLAPNNKTLLQEQFGIDVGQLGVDGKLTIMKAMLSVYSKEVERNAKT